MYIVTGGAGFVGSNIIKSLNKNGCSDIIVVDDIEDGFKLKKLFPLKIYDIISINEFYEKFITTQNKISSISAIFHNGACSETTNWDGEFVMRRNFEASKKLLEWAGSIRSPFIYASSASVYGLGGNGFSEHPENENPINLYAYSKLLFDSYVRRNIHNFTSQVVGLRYFNAYGPREDHKENMASIIYKHYNQAMSGNTLTLFKGIDGYRDGLQRRDFVYVDDIVDVNLWMRENSNVSGIYNVGTGCARTFNDAASIMIEWFKRVKRKDLSIRYVEFPDNLRHSYQNQTQADITALRAAGYTKPFTDLENGIEKYLNYLNH